MSRNTVALASPSRKVRMRPGCSSTYQRLSAAWNAPVIELNASPPIARASFTCGIAGAGVETGAGAMVGDGVGVAEGVALGAGDADGDGDATTAGDGAVDGGALVGVGAV